MTTGPEHYREAERLLDVAWHAGPLGDQDEQMPIEKRAEYLAMAQVHATLAQAAAVIELRSAYDATAGGICGAQTVEWEKAVGER